MTTLPTIHVCIVQPAGYIHSLGFLDQARYFRHQFRRMGAEVTLAKNRLRHDAVNVIFGAHLGFDPGLRQRYTCIFVNLEQLGAGGANVTSDYMSLLGSSAVVDYDERNVPAYTPHVDDVPIVPILHAPYLQRADLIPLADRPIDVLFIGSLNERRKVMLDQIESTGARVAMFDAPLYGPERDLFIQQAKCVFNAHFYESSRFEQARASLCLSLGTPLVSERLPMSGPHPAYEDSVFWVNGDTLVPFFSEVFGTPAYYEAAQRQLDNFKTFDPIEAYADVLAFAAGYGPTHQARRPQEAWSPEGINLSAGDEYIPGVLNLDRTVSTQPDALLDLSEQIDWPLYFETSYAGPVQLAPESVSVIKASGVLAKTRDIRQLMSNCLTLLKVGGQLLVDVPHEKAKAAWQDPENVRAFNERSWLHYTDWFWHMDWLEHRFNVGSMSYLDERMQPCQAESASYMRLVLTKVETTLQERTHARVKRADFGLPEDLDLM